MSNGCIENDLWRDQHVRGRTHRWRILDPAIPREVASPQSLFPFRQAIQAYHKKHNPFKPNAKYPK
jgi:hypothetical protein